ncbi:MAG: hypothetical protein H5U24_20085 [Thioclava marina]|uniref:hypothetical protein n=1 Tax=Thioclava marina TaxID=1915077 RepID=UPI0019A320CE|nr:hypothetical protein [Thioclava marina]MBC7147667.1 hypothetical protein [Thioclava marina]
MIAFDFDDDRLRKVAEEYAATPKQMELAANRAAKRTAGTLRRISTQGLKTELGMRNAAALRRRIKEFRVRGSGSGYKVWYGSNDLPVSSFKGRAKKVSGGIMYGDAMIYGAFFVTMGGKRKVAVRHGARRWSIGEATIPVHDRMMTWLEENAFVDLSSIFMKHFIAEIRARTTLEIGKS